jgi:hypothetical protein
LSIIKAQGSVIAKTNQLIIFREKSLLNVRIIHNTYKHPVGKIGFFFFNVKAGGTCFKGLMLQHKASDYLLAAGAKMQNILTCNGIQILRRGSSFILQNCHCVRDFVGIQSVSGEWQRGKISK